MANLRNLDLIDRKLRERVERIANTARKYGDTGIVAWTVRAADDALALGRIRDKDIETLRRLEDTYGHEYYSHSGSGNIVHA
jgi:hypothetical protein